MKPCIPKTRSRPRQRGIALIEALIGMLIFAFGVLGLMGLQAAMTKAQSSAKFRADAATLAADLFGLIQTDLAANTSRYATASCASYARCLEWKSRVAAQLPNGTAKVAVPGSGEIVVTIEWTQGSETPGKFVSRMNWQL